MYISRNLGEARSISPEVAHDPFHDQTKANAILLGRLVPIRLILVLFSVRTPCSCGTVIQRWMTATE